MPANGQGVRSRMVEAVLADIETNFSADFNSLLEEANPGVFLHAWFGATFFETYRNSKDVCALLARDIATIDTLLGEQVDAILHMPEFKKIESSWRGIELLVQTASSDNKIRIRLFNATWPELSRDFEHSIEFDQSNLFNKIYNEEYGMPGGMPFGLLIFDYAVRHHHPTAAIDDISTLAGIAEVSAAAFAPSVIGAAPELFGLSSFADLSYTQQLEASFQLPEYNRWHSLRKREESRFLGVVLPCILMRDVYRDDGTRVDGFRYSEVMSGEEDWLWGNASYAYGMIAIRAFRRWGWFAQICGEVGGKIDSLPTSYFSTRETMGYRRPLEVELTDKKQKVLDDLGLISLSPCNFSPDIILLSAQSLHSPSTKRNHMEWVNDRLSSTLRNVMCASRFAHYIKVMASERIGSYSTPRNIEQFINDWLRDYTIGNDDAPLELKARYPLSRAHVDVYDIPGRPGIMNCIMYLSPHFQFDQVVSSFRMHTEIHSARSG